MFFDLAIKPRDTCIRNIYLKCYIFREILGVSFIFFLYNQPKTKKVCESLPPPHFTILTKVMYMYSYKEYYVEWGSWYKEGTMLQRPPPQKTQPKMRVGVDIIFVQKLTEVYSN